MAFGFYVMKLYIALLYFIVVCKINLKKDHNDFIFALYDFWYHFLILSTLSHYCTGKITLVDVQASSFDIYLCHITHQLQICMYRSVMGFSSVFILRLRTTPSIDLHPVFVPEWIDTYNHCHLTAKDCPVSVVNEYNGISLVAIYHWWLLYRPRLHRI